MNVSNKPKLCFTYMAYHFRGKKFNSREELIEYLQVHCVIFDKEEWVSENYSAGEVLQKLENKAKISYMGLSKLDIAHAFDEEYNEYIDERLELLHDNDELYICETVGEIIDEETSIYISGETGEVLYG